MRIDDSKIKNKSYFLYSDPTKYRKYLWLVIKGIKTNHIVYMNMANMPHQGRLANINKNTKYDSDVKIATNYNLYLNNKLITHV